MSPRIVWAIARRDLRACFLSPLAWVTLAVFVFINGLTFISVLTLLSARSAGLAEPLQFLFGDSLFFWLFLLYLAPALTMRTFSEEMQSGTLEILLTAPVRESEMVVGKFLAAFGVYAFVWLSSLGFPLALSGFGPLDWGPIASSYIGVFGIGSMFLAIGVFASCLTRSQVLAAIITFGIAILFFLSGLLEEVAVGAVLREALSYTSLWRHMSDFARGIVDTRPLVYYVTCSVFFLFLASQTLAHKRSGS